MVISGRVFRNIIALMFGQVCTWSLTLLLTLYLPRYLGAEGLGKLTFATSIGDIGQAILLLGTGTFLVKEFARDRDKIGLYLGNALVLRLLMAVPVMLALVCLAHVARFPADKAWTLYLLGIAMVVGMIRHGFNSVLEATENMRHETVGLITEKAVITGVSIAMLLAGHGVVAVAGTMAVGAVVNLAINVWSVSRRHSLAFRPDFGIVRTLVKGGMPYLAYSLLRNLYARIDVAMISLLVGVGADRVLGLYGASLRVWYTFGFIPSILVTAVLPALARSFGDDGDGFRLAARKTLGMVVVASVPFTVISVTLGLPIIRALRYPAEFNDVTLLLAILGAGTLFNYLATMMGTVLMACDRQRDLCTGAVGGLILNVLMNLVALPLSQKLWGNAAIGACITTVLTEVWSVGWYLWRMPKGIIDGEFWNTLARAHVAGLAMAGLILLMRGLPLLVVLPLSGAWYLLVCLAAGALTWDDFRFATQAVLRRKQGKLAESAAS